MAYKDIPILMYHDIGDYNSEWCVSPSDFEEQMQLLKQEGYKTISLSELNEGIKKDKQTSDKHIVITFDDARKGVYTHALPLLKKLNFTATIFVVPQWIDKNDIPQSEQYSEFMSWEDVKECAQVFEIGSHTFSHKNLTKLDEAALNEELTNGKKIIEKKLNKNVEHFAYPFGKYNKKIRELITNQYTTAMTTNPGFDKSPGAFARQWVTRNTSLENFKKFIKKPTLSVCMITKNEEKNMESCLESVKDIAEEIVIVDTGSTDNTKSIAKNFTEKIYDMKWNDDFSEARNESLKHAAGDWILIMDADEIIDKDDHNKVLEAINNWDSAAYQMITLNYSDDSTITGWQPVIPDPLTRSFQGWYPSVKVRLFQRKQKIRFEGEIHEMVDKTIEGKTDILHVPIHHYGASKTKSEKYLEITKKKIAANPSYAKAHFELGVQYKELGEFELAEKAFSQSIRLGEQSAYPLLNLALVQQKQNKIEEAIKNYNKVIEKNKNADAYFGLGFCHFKKNNPTKAAEYFENAIKLKPQFLDAHINLGAMYEKLGRFQEAAHALKKAIRLSPSARAYYNLGVIHEKTSNFNKAVICYQRAIDLGYRKNGLKEKIERMKEL